MLPLMYIDWDWDSTWPVLIAYVLSSLSHTLSHPCVSGLPSPLPFPSRVCVGSGSGEEEAR